MILGETLVAKSAGVFWFRGRSGQRSWADTDAIGAGATVTLLHSETVGDTTEIRFTWSSRVFTGESSAFVTVDGDRVSLFRIPPYA